MSKLLSLNEEFTSSKKSYEENLMKLEAKAYETEEKLQKKILELESLLSDSRKRIKELEDFSEAKFLGWKRKEQGYRNFIDSQLGSIQVFIGLMVHIKNRCSTLMFYALELFRS